MYNIEDIQKSSEILYYLLEHGSLDIDSNFELYQAANDDNIYHLLKNMGSSFNSVVERFSGVIYLIPNTDNNVLGYSKVELRKRLCKSDSNNKDYYLSQFVILIILSLFYSSKSKSSNIRSFLRLGDLINAISDEFKTFDSIEDKQGFEIDSNVSLQAILSKWSSLTDIDNLKNKGTKNGFVLNIISFLEENKLVEYTRDTEVIRVTNKLTNFMDWHILNNNNYKRVMDAFEKAKNGEYDSVSKANK